MSGVVSAAGAVSVPGVVSSCETSLTFPDFDPGTVAPETGCVVRSGRAASAASAPVSRCGVASLAASGAASLAGTATGASGDSALTPAPGVSGGSAVSPMASSSDPPSAGFVSVGEADCAARLDGACHWMRGGSASGRPPNSASQAATSARFSRHCSSEIGGRIESQSERKVPRSWSRPYGRARNHMWRWADPSPHRLTWTRATPSSDRMARSSRTVITPNSAASRFGRSPRSRCDRDSRMRTMGSPVGRSMARTRHRSPTQM